jgi:cytidine deaminase
VTSNDHLAAAVRERVTRDGRVPAADVADLVATFGLDSVDSVMFGALTPAAGLADAPISSYRVGAVGLEAPSGDLLLGGNLEFPGGDLGHTLHAEGVVAIRSFLRGSMLTSMAIHAARPCAHCRQTLVEFAWADRVRLIDPHGSARTLAELYPWPFVPSDLDEPFADPRSTPWPTLAIHADTSVPRDIADHLTACGRRAHAPYSRCPAAAVLRLRDGRLVAGMTIENVAFNPTVGPMSVAIVALRAGGDAYADIESAWLAAPAEGPVDDVRAAGDLLVAIAPDAPLTATTWTGLDRG